MEEEFQGGGRWERIRVRGAPWVRSGFVRICGPAALPRLAATITHPQAQAEHGAGRNASPQPEAPTILAALEISTTNWLPSNPCIYFFLVHHTLRLSQPTRTSRAFRTRQHHTQPQRPIIHLFLRTTNFPPFVDGSPLRQKHARPLSLPSSLQLT